MDGTLVGSSNEVAPAVWEAAERARAAGIRLSLCSGRPAYGRALGYARQLNPDGWHIFQNGASIVNVGTLASSSEALPHDLLLDLVATSRRLERVLEVYTDSDYAVESDTLLAVEHAALLGLPYRRRDPLSLPGQVVRAQWVIPQEETEQLLEEPHEGLALHPASSPGMPGIMFVSVTREGVGKGSAVLEVAARYGLDPDRVMMVGDGHNDVTAMQVVGHPVAMGNADPQALAASRYRVGRVDDGGLIEALELAHTL